MKRKPVSSSSSNSLLGRARGVHYYTSSQTESMQKSLEAQSKQDRNNSSSSTSSSSAPVGNYNTSGNVPGYVDPLDQEEARHKHHGIELAIGIVIVGILALIGGIAWHGHQERQNADDKQTETERIEPKQKGQPRVETRTKVKKIIVHQRPKQDNGDNQKVQKAQQKEQKMQQEINNAKQKASDSAQKAKQMAQSTVHNAQNGTTGGQISSAYHNAVNKLKGYEQVPSNNDSQANRQSANQANNSQSNQ